MMNNEQQQRSDYLYEQHVTHLTLQGKRPATIDGYSRALRRITHHLDKSPNTLTTDDLKRYISLSVNIFYKVEDLRTIFHHWSQYSLNSTNCPPGLYI